MSQNFDTPSTEPSLIDWAIVGLKGWKLLLLTTLVGGILGYIKAKWEQPVYQSNSLIQIETEDMGGYNSTLGELNDVFSAVSKAETETEIVRTRMVLMPVVETLNLRYSATSTSRVLRFKGRSGRVELTFLSLPEPTSPKERPWRLVGRDSDTMSLVSPKGDSVGLVVAGQPFEQIYGEDTIQVHIDRFHATLGEEFDLGISDVVDVAAYLNSALSVSEKGKKTGVLQLLYLDRYPDQAARILNEIARAYMRQNIDAKSAEAQKTLTFLKSQLPGVKAKLDSAESELNNYRLSRGTVDLSAEAKLALDRQVQLGQQLLELQQKKQELSRLYENSHPQVAALNNQITRVQGAMGQSSGKVRALPRTQQEVLKLTRDLTVATQFYETMLDKIQQLEVVRAGEVGSARILDTAVIVDTPVMPNRRRIQMLGLAAGFAVGFLLLLLRKALDKGVRDAAQIEKLTQTSVFAQVPRSDVELRNTRRKGSRTILAAAAPEELALESLRSLRTALEFSLLGQSGKILGISGLTPGVGKSFVSTNLAALFAATNRRVLLIDADLRKGRLHTCFGCERNPGLSELLRKHTALETVLKPQDQFPGLYFIPTGTLPPNPSEMLGSAQLGELLKQLSGAFDLVVIDTPPLLLVTDPALVLRHVHHATLVLEQGQHTSSEIREGVRLARVREDLNLSLVLNKCDLDSGVYGKYGNYSEKA